MMAAGVVVLQSQVKSIELPERDIGKPVALSSKKFSGRSKDKANRGNKD